ncbi:MAG: iron-containing alcohol dehydrogenase [Myxococcales bacterium]|nr:iron-containing alcohol dehydrogenase [Myxococcales bacterium]
MYDFLSLSPERVRSGIGAASLLPEEVARVGGSRALIITGNTLANKTGLAQRLADQLGKQCVGVFDGSKQHVLASSVDAAVAEADRTRADVLISFGGGSPIDTAKMVAYKRLQAGAPVPPHIAVPTTLSAGEFTHAAGMTDDTTRVKGVYFDIQLMPRTVILDPELTVETPEWLWGATGLRAMDHAVEAVWAKPPHPLVSTLALRAAHDLRENLPRSRDVGDLELRLHCQHAAWMSIFGLLNLGLRLTHPIGHQLGARFDIPHGVTSCVVLPEAMRFFAERTTREQAQLAEAFGVAQKSDAASAAAAADAIEQLVKDLSLPGRLSDTSARKDELADVARSIAEELREFNSPDTDLATAEALEGLLRKVW